MAARRLREVNPHVELEIHEKRLVADNVMELVGAYDLVVDGSDNFPTRYLVNDACVLLGKPLVYGSVLRFAGQVSVFDSTRGPCYRCLFPEPPAPGTVPSCAEGGVLGVLPGIIGSLQALEAIKLIIGAGEPLVGRLVLFEGLRLDFREVTLARDPECPVCGMEPTICTPSDLEEACGARTAEPEHPAPRIGVEALAKALDRNDPPGILDVRRPEELAIAALAGAVAIPLAELPERMDELSRDRNWVITCHKGARAERAWQLLKERGFTRLQVLDGGIDAWAERVEPAMPRYA
jgi:adenylyltransferase/sulfurtransferase